MDRQKKSVLYLQGSKDDRRQRRTCTGFAKQNGYQIIKEFSGPEIVMSSTKYLSCALANDSGVSHMLSTKYCLLIKLFGHHEAKKFTLPSSNIIPISSQEYGSNNINVIKSKDVITLMEKYLTTNI